MEARKLLGARLRELRKRKGLTIEELSEKSDVSYKYLGGIERGTENPSVETLDKLARSLGVPIRELFLFRHLEKGLRRKAIELMEKCSEEEMRVIYRVLTGMKE